MVAVTTTDSVVRRQSGFTIAAMMTSLFVLWDSECELMTCFSFFFPSVLPSCILSSVILCFSPSFPSSFLGPFLIHPSFLPSFLSFFFLPSSFLFVHSSSVSFLLPSLPRSFHPSFLPAFLLPLLLLLQPCLQYWPEPGLQQFGPMTVELLSRTADDDVIVRLFRVQNITRVGGA